MLKNYIGTGTWILDTRYRYWIEYYNCKNRLFLCKKSSFLFSEMKMQSVNKPSNSQNMKDEHCVERNPCYEDMIISFATIPGYVAYRNNVKGSWFVQCFCKVSNTQSLHLQVKSGQYCGSEWKNTGSGRGFCCCKIESKSCGSEWKKYRIRARFLLLQNWIQILHILKNLLMFYNFNLTLKIVFLDKSIVCSGYCAKIRIWANLYPQHFPQFPPPLTPYFLQEFSKTIL